MIFETKIKEPNSRTEKKNLKGRSMIKNIRTLQRGGYLNCALLGYDTL
jgi:hypothetical protein